jgi:viroplasmin and RNaseH domain-containing protein
MKLSWQEAVAVVAGRHTNEYTDCVAGRLQDIDNPADARAFLDEVRDRCERMKQDIISWEDEGD